MEDDPDFGPRLKQFLSELDFATVELRECVSGKERGGLSALLDADQPFDLVVVDIMLPDNEASLLNRRRLQRTYDALTADFQNLQHDPERETHESGLRGRLEEVLKQARSTINYRGGLSMLKEFQREKEKKNEKAQTPALLFLTAIGDRSAREEAEQIAAELGAQFEYLVKPQSVGKLRETVRRLLERQVSHGS